MADFDVILEEPWPRDWQAVAEWSEEDWQRLRQRCVNEGVDAVSYAAGIKEACATIALAAAQATSAEEREAAIYKTLMEWLPSPPEDEDTP